MSSPTVDTPTLGVVILAAGGGSRFTGAAHKLLTLVDGRTVFEWALDSAIAAHVGPIAVVFGAVALPQPNSNANLTYIHNSNWSDGMATSVHCALAWATEQSLSGVVIGLGDQPCIPASAWQAVAASTSPLAVATYNGMRANPVKLLADYFSHVPTSGDEGARSLLHSYPELVAEVPCKGSGIDVDHIEDIDRVAHLIHESRAH